MSTSTVVPEKGTVGWPLKLLAAVLGLVMLVGLVLAGWFYSAVHAALPQLDGSTKLAGLGAKVRVVRDEHGVPTIEAASLEDLFFAQGYVTAQDRLWQMDAMRRFSGGEMAEILGPDFVKHDREQRILGLRQAARKAQGTLPARDLKFFQAYANGVNAFLDAHQEKLPMEFRLLKYHPARWTVEDSLLMGARMVQDLTHYNIGPTLTREKILEKLGPELTADLYVNVSGHDRPPGARAAQGARSDPQDEEDGIPAGENEHSMTSLHGDAADRIAQTLQGLQASPDFRGGSNNWVVSGEHTVTGKPLLSNDMHLQHQLPNLWFEVHLHSGDYDVAGFALPGTPYVIAGHNQKIAWGFTNLGATVEQMFVETFNSDGWYQTEDGWQAPEHRFEVIHVKDNPDAVVDVIITRHGPVISPLIAGETRKLALRWTLYDGMHEILLDVNTAQNWKEFRSALKGWDVPGQNVMYADVNGHIGYQATGHVPIRPEGDGSLLVNGADGKHEWRGFIPFDEMPMVYDPPSGILATANGRVTPNGYKYPVSNQWDASYRTERIYDVLESGKKFSAADMLALQTDVYSGFDRYCAEHLVAAMDRTPSLSERAKQAREILRDWNGRMSTDSAAPTIETNARKELVRLILEPKLGAAPKDAAAANGQLSWQSYHWFSSPIWLENVLENQPPRWLPKDAANYDALLVQAMEGALTSSDIPANLNDWRWGKASPVEIRNLVLSRLPVIGSGTGPGVHEQSGAGYTVKQVGRGFGPSERATYDLSNLDHSTANLVTGESGIYRSPYYMDQWKAWYEGTTFEMPFTAQAVEKAKRHEVVLEPGR